MLKNIIKKFYILPIYFILLIFQNCRTIYENSKENISIFNNLKYINTGMFVSIVFALFILIFYKNLKKYKITIVSSTFVILVCNLLNGILIGKKLDAYILVYLYLIFMSYIVSNISKHKFEISIFIFVSILLLSMFVLALFNLLIVVKYLLIISAILGVIYLAYQIKIGNKENLFNTFDNFNKSGIVIFSLLFVMFIIGGLNRYVNSWDEFSHWAFDAKAVINYNKLTTCEEVVSRTRDYPPMLTLWHYFINAFTGFNEENLYIGLSLFSLVFFMPAISFIKRKNRLLSPLIVISMVFSCYLIGGVYSYGSLYADLSFSIVFSNCFILLLLFKNDEKTFKRLLCLNLAILTLTKPTGFVLSSVFLFILIINDYMKLADNKCKNFKNNIFMALKKWWKPILVVIFVIIIWYGYIKIMNIIVNDYYDFRLIPSSLETSITSKLNVIVISQFFKNLIVSFNETTITSIVNLNLFQYIILIFSMMLLVFYYGNNKSLKTAFRKLLPFIYGYIFFFLLTLTSIFVMFSVYEAQNLASLGRYLNSLNLAMIIFLIAYICSKDFYEIGNNKLITLIILIMFVISIPYTSIAYCVFDHSAKIKAKDFSYNMNEKFRIVNENTNKNDLIYVLDQKDKDGIMAMWYARYYLFPRNTNASGKAINWKIRTDINGDDLGDWGLTADGLEKNLYNYNFDYLFLYTCDDYMFERMESLFSDYKNAEKYTLFKVEKKYQKIELIPVA